MRVALIIAVAAVAGLSVVPAPAQAKACPDTVAVSGERWQYQGTRVGCKFMKKAVRAYVRDGRKPAGFKCSKSAVNGLCQKGRKQFVFQQVQKPPKTRNG